ncbi:unnamed protein product [Rotaria sp. Silwood1]|nr:unnamed protein product [Rotaria sp. Silwood1]CAF3579253.1 unnamed protein product [Rotaria sp. Silwood1]CAF4857260.1 unnamed protein product [Rotaria sp. Silwood1]
MYSNLNSVIIFDRHRSSETTSDVGEYLYDNDLEWDQSDLTYHLPESDVLSSYDINEIAEILCNHYLEFNISSQIDECSTPICQSTINDIIIPIKSNNDSKKENFLENHSDRYLNKNSIIRHRLYRSLSNLNSIKQQKTYFLLSKHLSLMNIKSIECQFLKHSTSCKTILIKENDGKSFLSIPQSIEFQSEPKLINTITNINISSLSQFELIHSYLTQLKNKVYSFTLQIFQSTKIPLITTEEIIQTYDIIEE